MRKELVVYTCQNKTNSEQGFNGFGTRSEGNRTHRRFRLERNPRTRDGATDKIKVAPEADFGDSMTEKKDTVARLAFGNLDGFGTKAWNNSKAQELKAVIRHYEVDLFGGCEPNLNWKQMPAHGCLNEWFRTENALRTEVGYNEHENFGRYQQGGTFMLAFGAIASRMMEKGTDETGLGRWTWMRFTGREGHSTRIVAAYQPCRTSRHRLGTVYSQHLRYFESRGDFTCPREAFVRDLEKELCRWRQQGDRIVLMMDGNEDSTQGPLSRMLTKDRLQMREMIQERHSHLAKTGTYIRGSKPIDSIWATPDIHIDQGSWLAFFKGPADHRLGMFDVPYDILLGEDVLKVVRPAARRLSCNIPEAKTKYQKLLGKHFSQHNLLARLHDVYRSATGYLTPDQQAEMERLDKIRTEGMLYAEKRCRKLAMGHVDFSPEINDARKKRDFWRLVLRQRSGRRVCSRLIRRKAHACGITCPLSISRSQARKNFVKADARYRSLKPKAPDTREAWLVKRTRDPTLDDDAQKRASRMLRIERQRQSNRHLRRVQGTLRSGSVSKVEELNENGEPVIREGQEEVEQAVMANNEARFRLTENTPPMTEPLRSELGFLGNTEAARQILNGTYECPPEVDEYTKAFLAQIQVPQQQPQVRLSITSDDYIWYWKKAKERTSSSFSGLHFGHWKAAIGTPLLVEFHALFTEVAFTGGLPLGRWQQGLSVMLEKKPGLIIVDRLRAILLMEADFNFGNKLYFGSRMMRAAERNKVIPGEIYGGRKLHRAIELGLNRRLFADIMRQKRRNAAIASVDAHTCFDRIAHSIASLCCQRLFVDIHPVVTMLLTIQKMKFYLRTAYGDSESYYGGGETGLPFQGVCQGNGAGPAICIAVFIVMVLALRAKGHTAKIRSALSQAIIVLAGLIFIDDTDLASVAPDADTIPEQVVNTIQDTILTWQGLLRATGGALVPEKCSWWLLGFWWDNGQWKYHTKGTLPAEVRLVNEEGDLEAIKRLEPSEATKVVGLFQAMDGNMTAQFEDLEQRATKWGKAIKKHKVPDRIAWQGLSTVIWPSLKFPLAATNLQEWQGEDIVSTLYRTVLPSLGANRNFPMHWRFAPTRLQGLGLPHPYIEQGIAQLSEILYHGVAPTYTGSFIRASLEQAQLEVGSGTPLLQLPFDSYGVLLTENCWIGSVWEFTSKLKLLVIGEDLCLPKPQRLGDTFIMEELIRSRQFDDKTLISCNRCRVFMEVITLSDIATGDGRRLQPDCIGVSRNVPRCNKWEWPTEKPTRTDKSRWKEALRYFTTGNYTLRAAYRLGPWIREPHKPVNWRYDPPTNLLYRRHRNRWHCYSESQQQTTRRVNYRLSAVLPDDPPLHAEWATVDLDRLGRAHFSGSAPAHIPQDPVFESLTQLINSWGDEGWPLTECSQFPEDGRALAEGIVNGTALCSSDGAYKPRYSRLGAAAWIAEGQPNGVQCTGRCQTSGNRKEVNAYRSELQGLHAIMLALTAVCTFHKITAGSIIIGCDNLGGINLSKQEEVLVPTSRKHADLVRAIRRLNAELPIKVHFRHVYGHQDRVLQFDRLDRLSQLNILADEAAGDHLNELIALDQSGQLAECTSDIRKEGWQVWVRGKVTSDPAEAIRTWAFGNNLRDILDEKGKIPHDMFLKIDWDAVGDSMNEFPQLFRRWVTKHVSGWCAVGKMQAICGYWDSSKCPCCSEPIETTTHMLICPHEGLHENWNKALDGLERWMESADTHPEIQECIINTLWQRRLDASFDFFSSPTIETAAREQDEIGWQNFMEGKISARWRDIQEEHYRDIASRRTARRWAQNLVSSLLEMVHGQWKFRCDVVHERDAQGLKVAEGLELNAAITEQYDLGKKGLHHRDHHYFRRTLEEILALPALEKRQWAQTIHLARASYAEQTGSAEHRMRTFMENWLETG